jgi:hypothetical protein
MEGIPNLDIPRLQDLLSELIDDLTGPYRERVLGFFSEFDQTLSQNKTSIQNSIGNIVRAQLRLAEQCRPFFHKLVASQSRDTNIPGDTCRTMHTLSDHDTRDSGHCTSPSMPGKLLFFLINTLSHPVSYCYVSNIVTPFFHLFPGHQIHSHGTFVSAGTLLRSQIDEQSPICNTPGIVYFPGCMFLISILCYFFFVFLCHSRYVS